MAAVTVITSGTQMRQYVGFVIQVLVLMFTPLLIGVELVFQPHFLFLPVGLTAAAGLFYLGHFLRQP